MKAFANLISCNFILSKKENLYWSTCTGFGIQRSLTPSIIKTFLVSGLKVKVKGNGPANLLASLQFEKGEPSGRAAFSFSPVAITTLKPELIELTSKVAFCII